MDSCEVKSEECDFFQEFMDLEEFIDVSTKSATSPGPDKSPYGSDMSMPFPMPNGHAETSINGQSVLPGQPAVNLAGIANFSNTRATVETGNVAAESTDDNSLLGNVAMKDRRYWDRRLKNNIAAKRSRDAKREKETSVVKRWTFLEDENKRLKQQIAAMKRRLNVAMSTNTVD